MRPRIVRRLVWLAAIVVLWLPLLPPPPLATAPFLQHVTTTAATVALVTPDATEVRARAFDTAGSLIAEGVSSDRRRHRLRLTGLEPGRSYRYEVTEGEQARGGGTLRTPPADDRTPIRFAVLGDSGAQPWWVWLQTAPLFHLPARWHWLPPRGRVAAMGEALAAYEPAFVLHLGDIVYPKGRHQHYSSAFFRPFATALANAPFYPALGNHDVMDTGGLQTMANLHLPTGDVTGDGRCYSFAHGPLRVICLDCTDMFAVNGRFEPGHPARRFLRQELASRPEPWVIVASHYPMRSASRQQDRADLLLHMLPLLEEHGVAAYFAGHDHCYQRFDSAPGEARSLPLVVSGGGGKSLYEVDPGKLKQKGGVVYDTSYHWCGIEIDGGLLRLQASTVDGRRIDMFERNLPAGNALEHLRTINPARAARIDALR